MGYLDRDYQKGPVRGGGLFSRLEGCPVVKWLLISNIAVFFLDILLTTQSEFGVVVPSALSRFGVFTIQDGLLGGQIWRLLTFQFLHVSTFHLLFNLYALFLFGPLVENYFKSRAFLIFYLICGVAGALFYCLVSFLNILPNNFVDNQLLGASAGVFGVLIGVAMIGPNTMMRLLFPPITLTMKTFALVMVGIEVVLLITNSSNAGGSAGHLGGALMGFLTFKIPSLGEKLISLGGGSPTQRGSRTARGKAAPKRKRADYKPKIRPRSELSGQSGEVDRILDKINEHGLHSLTEAERKILQEASKR